MIWCVGGGFRMFYFELGGFIRSSLKLICFPWTFKTENEAKLSQGTFAKEPLQKHS